MLGSKFQQIYRLQKFEHASGQEATNGNNGGGKVEGRNFSPTHFARTRYRFYTWHFRAG